MANFMDAGLKAKPPSNLHLKGIINILIFNSDPAGTRTQGPYIKSVLLYQLSYQIILLNEESQGFFLFWECENRGRMRIAQK